MRRQPPARQLPASSYDLAIDNAGDIETLGEGSFGILAQSIGGGGGTAGLGMRGEGDVGIGGSGGAAGDGGDVDLDIGGRIDTHETAAHGVVAQSIGGGGGIAGNLDIGIVDSGLSLSFGFEGGSAGDGGRIDVGGSGDVVTRGDGANGMLLQSIGGGGGLAGEIEAGIGFAGSTGGDGSGGRVRLDYEGNITTLGDVSHGIFAQSAGGQNDSVLQQQTTTDENGDLAKNAAGDPIFTIPQLLPDRPDFGGDVELSVAGDVKAYGKDSHGIWAQSIGDDGNGDLTVEILDGEVQGGSGSGVGVLLSDGDENKLRNEGTLSALSGTAIRANGENAGVQNTVENAGTVIGNVELGIGTASFWNEAPGELRAGPIIDLGGGLLRNEGVVRLRRETPALWASLTGDFLQLGSGSYQARVNPDGSHDRLAASGLATLAGELLVERSRGLYRDGTFYDVLTAGAGIAPSTFFEMETLPDLPLLRFSVDTLDDRVRVQVEALSFNTVASNDLERSVAAYMQRLLPTVDGDLEVVFGDFQQLESGAFGRAFTSLSSSVVDDVTLASFAATRSFNQVAHQRMLGLRSQGAWLAEVAAQPAVGDLPPVAAREPSAPISIWVSGLGEWGDFDSRNGYEDFDYWTAGFALGADALLGRGFLVGIDGGMAFTDQDFGGAGGGADIEHGFVSLYGTWTGDRVYVEQVVSYGRNDNDVTRQIQVGPTMRRAKSDYDSNAWSTYSETGVRLPLEPLVLEPYLGLLWARLDDDSFDEQGAGSLNLRVDGRDSDSLQSDLGLRVRGRIPLGERFLIPRFTAAWVHDYDIDDRDLVSGFQGKTTFGIEGRDLDEDTARLGVDLRLVTRQGFTAALIVNSRIGANSRSASGQLELGWQF